MCNSDIASRLASLGLSGLLAAVFSCQSSIPSTPQFHQSAPLARPENCKTVAPEASLAQELERAAPGDVLCLSRTTYVGQIEIPENVAVFGERDSIIKTSGTGTTVLLRSGASLLGVTVDGSGGRFDVLDAAVKVNGDDVRVEGVAVINSVFGVLVEKSKRPLVLNNHVVGTGGEALGMRGDGIRLWEAYDGRVEGNRVESARDCVVWYSSNNVIKNNQVVLGRYGVHLMYSHRNSIIQNHFSQNEVGIFAMYSRDVTIEDNQLLFSRGAAGIGLGLKESGNVFVRRNTFVYNTQGLFLDNSPLNPNDVNVFEGNEVRLSEIGVGFLSSQTRNAFRQNAFIDNLAQVRVDGGGDAMGVSWQENVWSDYAGYDLNHDGMGDLPYELKDLSDALSSKHPDFAFLRGTPALALVSLAGEAVPLFTPKPVLRDEQPRMKWEVKRAN